MIQSKISEVLARLGKLAQTFSHCWWMTLTMTRGYILIFRILSNMLSLLIPPSNEARTYYGEITMRSLIAKVYWIKEDKLLLKALKWMYLKTVSHS